jgi:hypothetical protein
MNDDHRNLAGVLKTLRAVVAEGGPAYDRLALGIEATRQAGLDAILRAALDPEDCTPDPPRPEPTG